MDAGRDQARDVGHVDEQQRPDAVGDRGHPLEVDDPRVGRGARDDELRTDLLGLGGQRVVVDPLGVLADAIGVDLVQLAAEVQLHAVGQVAALVELHPENRVAGLEDAEVGGHVRLGPGVGLDVDVLGAREERQRPLLGERLGDVDVLAAAVVALARQSLGVLVRQPAALGLHDGGRRCSSRSRSARSCRAGGAVRRASPPRAPGRPPRSARCRGPRARRWSSLASSSGRPLVGRYLPTNPAADGPGEAVSSGRAPGEGMRARTGARTRSRR